MLEPLSRWPYVRFVKNLIMRYLTPLFFTVAVFLCPAPALTQTSESPTPVSSRGVAAPATIRPGDAVQITVWRNPELSGEFFVAGDGSIAHPFYQEVKVSGISPENAAERVQRFLEQYETSPRVRVDPLYRVSVGGEVRQPRLYTLRPEVSLSEAIDMAGGPTDRGRLRRVTLYRDGQLTKIDLTGTSPEAASMRVQSGDRIIVDRHTSVFRQIVLPTISVLGSVASIANAVRRLR
jgi:polysaccharide biosynthesis/export protein